MKPVTVSLTAVVSAPSRRVSEVIDAVALEAGDLRRTLGPDGGVRTKELRAVLQPDVTALGFVPYVGEGFAARALSWVAPSRRTAISVHGGRAHTNNEVLLAVLGAAASAEVDWLVAVLPERYKNSPTCSNVAAQLNDLADASGIELALVGVTLVSF